MKFTKEKIYEIVKNEGVKFIRLQFTDIFGVIKNVEIPVSQLDKALSNQIMFDGSSIDGFVRIEESDMYLYPDLDTWAIYPWTKTNNGGAIGRFICDIYTPDGKPFTGDPRGNLKRILKEMEELGFTNFNLGPEPEFYLFKMDEKGEPTLEVNDKGGYFDFAPVDSGENCRRDIVIELEKMGFEVEASHHEVGNGQHEIDFKYANAIRACDDIQTFKLAVKTIARTHNLHATFMAKPLEGHAGSGMHCNVSLSKGNENAFYDEKTADKLSETAKQFIAGVINHVQGFTAVTNPTINSYKRLVPGYEAPCYVAWSAQNRSPLIRIPAARGMSTRVELRSVDPTTNPYLALAVILKAGLEGIKNKMIAPEPIEHNIYAMSVEERKENGIEDLPGSLPEALSNLKSDEVMKEALGAHIYEHFVVAKDIECEAFRNAVHQWERDNYISNY